MNFTLTFIAIGIAIIFAFVIGAANVIVGYEEDENKNLIPDKWERFFGRKINKK